MSAPWDKTASDLQSEERSKKKVLSTYKQRAKPTWEQGSLTSREAREVDHRRSEATKYSYSTPWTLHQDNILEDFDRQVAALDYSIKKPWDEPENNAKSAEPPAYQYKSMWEPQEMSKERYEQLASYEYNPPYRCEFNMIEDKHKRNRRMIKGHDGKTLPPWAHGSEPAAHPSKSIFPKPQTVLWDAPPPNPAATALESSGDPILDSLRVQLKARGALGICGLAKKFKIMDDDNSGALDFNEFSKAMRECEVVDLSKRAIGHLFRYFDKDDSGSISYNEFLVGVRGVLNSRRRQLVHAAFQLLDKDQSGEVWIDDLRGVYDVRSNPQVIAKVKTEEEALLEFLDNFDVGGERDGKVTLQEFENYYSNISASIDSDDYFELMMRNAWHISGGAGWCANTTNTRVLVTHQDGRQTVEEVKSDLGLKSKDKMGLVARLRAQGINAQAVNVDGSGGMDGDATESAHVQQPSGPVGRGLQQQPPPASFRPSSAASAVGRQNQLQQLQQLQQQRLQTPQQTGEPVASRQGQGQGQGTGRPKPVSLSATVASAQVYKLSGRR